MTARGARSTIATGSTGNAHALRAARVLGVVVCLLLLGLYLLGWMLSINGYGGLERFARFTDFIATPTGAQIIANDQGAKLYDLQTQQETQWQMVGPYLQNQPTEARDLTQMLVYIHPPFEAMLAEPFVGLPVSWLYVGWDLLMVLALVASVVIMARSLPLPGAVMLFMALGFASYFPVVRGLMLGQNTPLVLLGLCLVYAAQKQGTITWTAVGLVLIAFKPQLVPVVALLLLLRGNWKSLVAAGGVYTTMVGMAMLALGPEWPLQYVRFLASVGDSEAVGIHPEIMHNWRGLAANLFAGEPAIQSIVVVLLSLVSVGLVIWAWLAIREHGGRSTQAGQVTFWDLLWALGALSAVLVSPHLNPHDLILLLFPAWIVAGYACSVETHKRFVWFALLWVGYALAPLQLIVDSSPAGHAVTVLPDVTLLGVTSVLVALAIVRAARVVAGQGEPFARSVAENRAGMKGSV